MRLLARISGLLIFTTCILHTQPKLSLDKPEVDLGILYSGMIKKGTIVFKNIGNDTLRIISVQPQCGCTTVKRPKDFLLPNESDVAEVEFNSTGYRGKVEKHVSITTNDLASQYVDVKLIAEVKEELEPIGYSAFTWLGNVVIGKAMTQTISFKNVSGHHITIQDIKVSSPIITAKTEKKTLNPSDTINVQVTVKTEKAGYNNEHFTIEIDSKYQPYVEMSVRFIGTQETK